LDAINSAHLSRLNAPEHIFFSIAPIDERLPALEDSGSWPQLLKYYKFAAYDGHFIRMDHRMTLGASDRIATEMPSVTARVGEWFDVPSGAGPIWAKLKITKRLFGQIAVTAYKLPNSTITLLLDNGTEITRRYIPSMGESGFLLSPYIGGTEDFMFMAYGIKRNIVRKIKIDSSMSLFRERDVQASFTHIEFANKGNRGAELSSLLKFNQRYNTAIPVPESSRADCALDHFDTISLPGKDTFISFDGWAAPSVTRGEGPEDILVMLTDSSGTQEIYNAMITDREDVKQYFHHPEMSAPGYSGRILLPGKTGVLMLDVVTLHGGRAIACGLNKKFQVSRAEPILAAIPAADLEPGGFVDTVSREPSAVVIDGWGMLGGSEEGRVMIDTSRRRIPISASMPQRLRLRNWPQR
jgi:hypothetical protein